MGKNKYGDLEEQEFQNALDTQAGKEKTVELGASDSYPGDITKDENGNYPADWNKWKIGENGYPAFVKESNN